MMTKYGITEVLILKREGCILLTPQVCCLSVEAEMESLSILSFYYFAVKGLTLMHFKWAIVDIQPRILPQNGSSILAHF